MVTLLPIWISNLSVSTWKHVSPELLLIGAQIVVTRVGLRYLEEKKIMSVENE